MSADSMIFISVSLDKYDIYALSISVQISVMQVIHKFLGIHGYTHMIVLDEMVTTGAVLYGG